jgi:hypothetical protein
MKFPASSMWMMRATWALVLVLPWPAYVLELWVAQQFLATDGLVPWRTVTRFGVGRSLAALVSVAIGVACVGPRIAHRRAIERLRGRARFDLDPLRDGTYRASPLVRRFPDDAAALKAAYARYGARSAATLAVIASLELVLFFSMTLTKSFACLGGGTTVHVPSAREYVLLLGGLVVVTALEFPRRGAVLQRVRDLIGAGQFAAMDPGEEPKRTKPS